MSNKAVLRDLFLGLTILAGGALVIVVGSLPVPWDWLKRDFVLRTLSWGAILYCTAQILNFLWQKIAESSTALTRIANAIEKKRL